MVTFTSRYAAGAMTEALLGLLRCPFCGTRLDVVGRDERFDWGVLGCQCCAYPVIAGIPVVVADNVTREAMHVMEAGDRARALTTVLGLDGPQAAAFNELVSGTPTYRDLLGVLGPDAEGTYFLHRFADPTFVMVEGVMRALGAAGGFGGGALLDLCGGTGHLTHLLSALAPSSLTVLADVYFWKLWLARRFVVPGVAAVCCDANQPLPFAPETFSATLLCDAYPYIWQRRMLASEMIRASTPDGAIVMPHLHSSLGENYAAGMSLTPAAYQGLFAAHGPRLLDDTALLDQAIDGGAIDLGATVTPEMLGDAPTLTLLASPRTGIFRRWPLPPLPPMRGELRVNPLYRVERRGAGSVLTLHFPTEEYDDEFGECRRYLPESLTIPGDASGAIDPAAAGVDVGALRRRKVLIDVPRGYL